MIKNNVSHKKVLLKKYRAEEESIYKVLLLQVYRFNDGREKSRNYLETKVTLLFAQASIVLGALLSWDAGIYKAYAIPVIISIVFYAIAFWPRKMNDTPSIAALKLIASEIESKRMTKPDDLYKYLSGYLKQDEMSKALEQNKFGVSVQRCCIRLGIISNIIGLVGWLLAVFIPGLLIKI